MMISVQVFQHTYVLNMTTITDTVSFKYKYNNRSYSYDSIHSVNPSWPMM